MGFFTGRRMLDAEEFQQVKRRVGTLEEQMEKVMADIDTLNSALDSISTDVDATLGHVNDLTAELATLQQSTGVDLSGPIAKAAAIKAKLEGVSTTATTTATSTT